MSCGGLLMRSEKHLALGAAGSGGRRSKPHLGGSVMPVVEVKTSQEVAGVALDCPPLNVIDAAGAEPRGAAHRQARAAARARPTPEKIAMAEHV